MAKSNDNLDKPILADRVTDGIGSGGFILAQTAFLVIYLCWNTLLPSGLRFDPEPYILLNLLLSFQAGYTGPVVLWSQNRSAKRDRKMMEQMSHAVAQIFRLDKRHDKDMREMNAKLDALAQQNKTLQLMLSTLLDEGGRTI